MGLFSTLGNVVRICFYAAVVLAGVTFAVSNRGRIDLTFYPVPYVISVPLFLFAVVIFILGLFLGWSIAHFKTVTYKRAHRHAGRRVAALENELGSLRAERLAARPAAMTLPTP